MLQGNGKKSPPVMTSWKIQKKKKSYTLGHLYSDLNLLNSQKNKNKIK